MTNVQQILIGAENGYIYMEGGENTSAINLGVWKL